MENLIGQTLGRYQITALLGQGGMGAVYRAQDLALKRDVAIKVMHANFASQSEFQRRFLQEGQVAARLDHPGIVKVFDFGNANGMLYIVMEFVAGANLAQMLRVYRMEKRWLPMNEAVQLVRQIALALDYAHKQGVLHRDIKPANIMIKPTATETAPYQPIITDLGLAKLASGGLSTQVGSSMGTPAYMSPEQALGEETDARSDVYSLGILLYELVLGQLPFPAETLSQAIRYHTKEAPPAPTTLRSDIPAPLVQVILRALEKDPARRFATAGELAQALVLLPATTMLATVPNTALAGGSGILTQYQQSLLSLRGQSVLDEFPEPSAGPTQLQLLSPDGTAKVIAVDKRVITLGRGPENDLVLNDGKVSRQHLRIEFDGTAYRVTDLDSANGTYLGQAKLLPGVAEAWAPEKPLRVGSHHLRLVPAQAGADMTAVTRASLGGRSGAGQVGVFTETTSLEITPGEQVTLPVVLLNQSTIVDHFKLTVDGLPTAWAQVPPAVQLLPGAQQEVTVTLRPPRTPQSRAGNYPVTLRVNSQSSPNLTAARQLQLTVKPFNGFQSQLQPQQTKIDQPVQVTVQNQGNTPQAYQLLWQDRANELVFDPPDGQVQAQPGENATLNFRARLQRRRWFGGEKQHPISIRVNARDQQPQTQEGVVVSRGFIPLWVPPLLLLLLACGVAWALNVIKQRTDASLAAQQTATVVQQIALATQTALAQTNLNAAQAATATALWLDQDDDRDGLTNRQELKLNTLPNNRDTDQDGIDDGEEINKWGTDPLKADTDGDGIKDGDEISRGINPKLVDTDKDGINDASDPDPGHVPTPTPNLAATAAFVATQTEGARQVAAATMTEAARQTEAAQILTLTAQAPTATPLPADTSVPTIAPTTVPTEAPTPTVPPTANQCLNGLPNPVLVFAGSEDYEANGQQWTRYSLQVDNRGQFPDELFTAAPDLPPCGANSNAARTWVDIFSNDNTRLYGFCALSTANDLDSLWFATQRGATPPASVYMTLQDRRCGTTYTSNPVAIPTLTPQVIHLDDYAPAALIESSELAPDGHNAVAGTVTQLAWMGGEGDGVGFVRLDAVQMEDGSTQNALRMHPKWVPHGSVKMWFKSATVHVTAHAQFMAQVGFLAGAGSPDGVTFWAWEHHQEGGNETWNPIVQATKLPNGSLQAVQADLSGLAGKDVYIELRVDAGESSGQDWAAWIDPRIELSN